MKKLIFSLVAALPLVFVSCGNDEEDNSMSLDKGAVTINYGGTTTLKASEKNVTWSSDNEFVASVDSKGVVSANHVGEAKIFATKDGYSVACNVTVTGLNNNFQLPILEWGATYSYIENAGLRVAPNLAIDHEATENGKNIFFYTNDGTQMGFPWYNYAFDNNGLAAVTLSIDIMQDTDSEGNTEFKDFEGFLDERYEYYSQSEDEDGFPVYFYRNANSTSQATVFVEYGVMYNSGAVYATFSSTASSSARAGVVVRSDAANRSLAGVKARLAK